MSATRAALCPGLPGPALNVGTVEKKTSDGLDRGFSCQKRCFKHEIGVVFDNICFYISRLVWSDPR